MRPKRLPRKSEKIEKSLNESLVMFKFLFLISFLLAPDFSAQDARAVSVSKLTGGDELYDVDVILQDGKHAIVTSGRVTIDQILGSDPQATSYFYIGTELDADGVGLAGDTVTISIPAAVSPLNAIYPAVSSVTTVTAGMLISDKPERALATQICDDLDLDPNFAKPV